VIDDRIPHYSHADLTRWYRDNKKRMRVLEYYSSRCLIDLEILESQELTARVWYVLNMISSDYDSEQARVLGIDFYSVFSRGSQFKVESLMVRIAKAECFMLISPSRKQVPKINGKSNSIGRTTKCTRMYTLSYGTNVEFLSESGTGT
jgi:DNA polymerase zeta